MQPDWTERVHAGIGGRSQTGLEHTRRAYSTLAEPHKPNILDIGCGAGDPTLELAKLSDGYVVGLDTDSSLLTQLAAKAERTGLSDRVRAVRGSLFNLPFANGSFDILWSEGSIHFIGFEEGLDTWSRLVKLGGFLVVHEATSPGTRPPEEMRAFWRTTYGGWEPPTASQYLAALPDRGFAAVAHFEVPASVWWADYFGPLADRIRHLRQEHADDQEALAVLEQERRTVDLFKRFPDWSSSAFYVMQRTS